MLHVMRHRLLIFNQSPDQAVGGAIDRTNVIVVRRTGARSCAKSGHAGLHSNRFSYHLWWSHPIAADIQPTAVMYIAFKSVTCPRTVLFRLYSCRSNDLTICRFINTVVWTNVPYISNLDRWTSVSILFSQFQIHVQWFPPIWFRLVSCYVFFSIQLVHYPVTPSHVLFNRRFQMIIIYSV